MSNPTTTGDIAAQAAKEIAGKLSHANVTTLWIEDIINAALAAEMEKARMADMQRNVYREEMERLRESTKKCLTINHQLHEQLAADREEQGRIRMNLGKHVEQLGDQLAAERDKRETFGAELYKEIQQLREQLAADRDKMATLHDVLQELEAEFGLTNAQRTKIGGKCA